MKVSGARTGRLASLGGEHWPYSARMVGGSGARGSLRQNGRQKSLVCGRDSVGKGREFVSHSTSGPKAALVARRPRLVAPQAAWLAQEPDMGPKARMAAPALINSGKPWKALNGCRAPERLSRDGREGAAQGSPGRPLPNPHGPTDRVL